jgi:hypothetical protein
MAGILTNILGKLQELGVLQLQQILHGDTLGYQFQGM